MASARTRASDRRPRAPLKPPAPFPPYFGAGPGESWRDWKRAVRLWIIGEAGSLPDAIIGPRMLARLTGQAATIAAHITPERAAEADGQDHIIAVLEANPMIKDLDNQRGDRSQREFLKLRRKAGESFDSYCARAQLHKRLMTEEDPNFAMGERFFVGFLLDNAEVTQRDRAMILAAAANQMTEEAIVPALRRVGPFLHGSVAIGQSEHDRVPVLRWGESSIDSRA